MAAPLTIIVAGIAIALLGNTLSQFSRAHPSTGGFISYVGKTFGGTSAVTTALLCGAGYIIAISSVLAICGGYISIVLQYYFNVDIPWGIFSVVFTAGAVLMMIRGVAVSTKLAGLFFGFEMLVLIVVSVAALIKNGGHLSAVRSSPATSPQRLQRPGGRFPAGHLPVHRLGELGGAGRGDRQPAPERAAGGVPVDRADGGRLHPVLSRPPRGSITTSPPRRRRDPVHQRVPRHRGWLSLVAYLAGITSTLGVLISAVFGAAGLQRRPGRAAAALAGKVHPQRRTPVNAIYVCRHRHGDHRRLGAAPVAGTAAR